MRIGLISESAWTCLAWVVGTALLASAVGQEGPVPPRKLTLEVAGPAQKKAQIVVSVDAPTGPDQLGAWGGMLWDQGNAALRQAVAAARAGTVSAAGSPESPLSAALAAADGEGVKVTLVTAVPIPALEPLWPSPTRIDLLTVVELKLDGQGRGEGRVFRTSQMEFGDNGELLLESEDGVLLDVSTAH